jgi:hypothetical protein
LDDVEYLGPVKVNRLTSLEEDFKESRRQFWQDEADDEKAKSLMTPEYLAMWKKAEKDYDADPD